jgi:hypothetical protein
MHPRARCRASEVVPWLLLAVGAAAAPTPPARALTPESFEVRAAIGKGIKYLESDAATDDRVGAHALVGIALLKHGVKPEHPKIVAAVAQVQQSLGSRDPTKVTLDIYSTGLSIVFLVQLEPAKYRSDIECLMKYLRWRQKPHGGWGYPEQETGDTSMTQYGVLSSWEAAQAGLMMPVESIEHVTSWLLKTQDPSGGFGYQGKVSDGNTLVPQSDVKHSMTAAGLGSLCICTTLLGIGPKLERRDDTLPVALEEIKPKGEEGSRLRGRNRIDARLVHDAQARGAHWLQANYQVNPGGYTHYYFYALERCMSFLELIEHRREKEPKWYNDTAQFLIKTQAENGSWTGMTGAVPDTAFSVLFLLRSTRRSIERVYSFGDGTLVSGRGLPKDTDRVEIRAGQIVAKPLLGPAEGLLASIDDPEHQDCDSAIAALAQLPAPNVEALVAKHGETLRRLVDNKSPQARLSAVRALGKTRSLDQVPILLYAMTDPDADVARAAHESLLRISRNPTAVHLPEPFSDADRHAAIENWKAWYLSIRPDAELDF